MFSISHPRLIPPNSCRWSAMNSLFSFAVYVPWLFLTTLYPWSTCQPSAPGPVSLPQGIWHSLTCLPQAFPRYIVFSNNQLAPWRFRTACSTVPLSLTRSAVLLLLASWMLYCISFFLSLRVPFRLKRLPRENRFHRIPQNRLSQNPYLNTSLKTTISPLNDLYDFFHSSVF